MRLRNGKLKAAVPANKTALWADSAILVVLEQGDQLALEPIDPTEAVAKMMHLEAGFDLLEEESRQVTQRITDRGTWRLILDKYPAAAVALLAERFSAN